MKHEPRSATITKVEKDASGPGVIAVERALKLLEAFGVEDVALTLAELGRRAGMHKTTALRIARSLAARRYLVHRDDGLWRLGPATGLLGARYQATFDVNNAVEPMLRELSRASGESASFYVREGSIRTCLMRVEGPQAVRHHVRIGEVFPLDKGSPGRVILAFSGQPGEFYERIRSKGYGISLGERDPQVASVSAPVFGSNWTLLGSICISGPVSRLTQAKLESHAKLVKKIATQLSYDLGGGMISVKRGGALRAR